MHVRVVWGTERFMEVLQSNRVRHDPPFVLDEEEPEPHDPVLSVRPHAQLAVRSLSSISQA
jgi:hypothetical protein